jgi:hypothetical protein
MAPSTPASPPPPNKDPLAPVKSSPEAKLELYDPLVLERISQAAKELQKSGERLCGVGRLCLTK